MNKAPTKDQQRGRIADVYFPNMQDNRGENSMRAAKFNYLRAAARAQKEAESKPDETTAIEAPSKPVLTGFAAYATASNVVQRIPRPAPAPAWITPLTPAPTLPPPAPEQPTPAFFPGPLIAARFPRSVELDKSWSRYLQQSSPVLMNSRASDPPVHKGNVLREDQKKPPQLYKTMARPTELQKKLDKVYVNDLITTHEEKIAEQQGTQPLRFPPPSFPSIVPQWGPSPILARGPIRPNPQSLSTIMPLYDPTPSKRSSNELPPVDKVSGTSYPPSFTELPADVSSLKKRKTKRHGHKKHRKPKNRVSAQERPAQVHPADDKSLSLIGSVGQPKRIQFEEPPKQVEVKEPSKQVEVKETRKQVEVKETRKQVQEQPKPAAVRVFHTIHIVGNGNPKANKRVHFVKKETVKKLKHQGLLSMSGIQISDKLKQEIEAVIEQKRGKKPGGVDASKPTMAKASALSKNEPPTGAVVPKSTAPRKKLNLLERAEKEISRIHKLTLKPDPRKQFGLSGFDVPAWYPAPSLLTPGTLSSLTQAGYAAAFLRKQHAMMGRGAQNSSVVTDSTSKTITTLTESSVMAPSEDVAGTSKSTKDEKDSTTKPLKVEKDVEKNPLGAHWNYGNPIIHDPWPMQPFTMIPKVILPMISQTDRTNVNSPLIFQIRLNKYGQSFALLDTALSFSLITQETVDRLKLTKLVVPQLGHHVVVHSLSPMVDPIKRPDIIGRIPSLLVHVGAAKPIYTQFFVVKQAQCDCVLGIDFVRTAKAIVNMHDNIIGFDGGHVKVHFLTPNQVKMMGIRIGNYLSVIEP